MTRSSSLRDCRSLEVGYGWEWHQKRSSETKWEAIVEV